MATLIVEGECECTTLSEEVQSLLKSKYNVEPAFEEIDNVLADIWFESTGDSVLEMEDGFFKDF